MTDIERTSVERIIFGVKSVTASATQLTTEQPSDGVYRGVLLKAPGTTDDTPNTLSVFVGNSKVTADQASTGGFPLAPGESLVLPLTNPSKVYVIATDTAQKINWVMV